MRLGESRMGTVFIAVQCFQCSTMQVKQQKKSSNKWTCVICNQKQSVRKVFARGFQAKDVRKFVQGFNTARQVADETLISPIENEEEEEAVEESRSRNYGKRRTDWSEYLDPEDEEKGSDCEGVVATELPKEMFKRPKLKSPHSFKSDGKKLYSPTFAKRKPNSEPSNSKNYSAAGLNKSEGKKLYSPTFAKRKLEGSTINPQEHDGAGKSWSHMAQAPSKWSDYLAQDEDYVTFGMAEDSSDAQGPWNYGMLETSFNDKRVEDEVHPDFL